MFFSCQKIILHFSQSVNHDKGLFVSHLLTRYPGLWRRQATPDERKRIETQGVISASSMNNITLVKTKEIEELIECQGLEDKVEMFGFRGLVSYRDWGLKC